MGQNLLPFFPRGDLFCDFSSKWDGSKLASIYWMAFGVTQRLTHTGENFKLGTRIGGHQDSVVISDQPLFRGFLNRNSWPHLTACLVLSTFWTTFWTTFSLLVADVPFGKWAQPADSRGITRGSVACWGYFSIGAKGGIHDYADSQWLWPNWGWMALAELGLQPDLGMGENGEGGGEHEELGLPLGFPLKTQKRGRFGE